MMKERLSSYTVEEIDPSYDDIWREWMLFLRCGAD